MIKCLIDIQTGIRLQHYENQKPDYNFWIFRGFGLRGFKTEVIN